MSCTPSCSALPFSSSQYCLVWLSCARMLPASPEVTNLDRASQSASMRTRTAFLSSKASPTAWRDAIREEFNEGKHTGNYDDKRSLFQEEIYFQTEKKKKADDGSILFFFSKNHHESDKSGIRHAKIIFY